jgi:hypothetical protein
MYRALCNDSSDRRKFTTNRPQPSCRTNCIVLSRLILVTMVLALKLFVANTYHCKRQSHCTMTLFASCFTPVRSSNLRTILTIGTSTRPTQSQQSRLATPKILPTVVHLNKQRQESFFALSDTGTSGRIDEPLVVLEGPSDMVPSLTAIATPKAQTTESLIEESYEPVMKINEASARQGTVIITDDADFIRPDRDLRSYRFIQLPNNLQCLLVCDNMQSGVGVEAASVHVKAGHFDDTIPGLARTCCVDIDFSV